MTTTLEYLTTYTAENINDMIAAIIIELDHRLVHLAEQETRGEYTKTVAISDELLDLRNSILMYKVKEGEREV